MMNVNEQNDDIDVNAILDNIRSYFGFIPHIFRVLSKNPAALNAYYIKLEVLMTDESLPPLTKEFISIGAASALGAHHCLLTHLKVAKELGATNDQLHLAILLGSVIAETDALAKSLRVFEEFEKL